MKFVVNAKPGETGDCPWSDWLPTYELNPKNSGRYMCKVDNRACDLDKNKIQCRCRWLIAEDND